jgi:hypothetical protein
MKRSLRRDQFVVIGRAVDDSSSRVTEPIVAQRGEIHK